MPQSHNKGNVGENSRLTVVGKYSENTFRNLNVMNVLESNMAKVKLHVMERNAVHSMQKLKSYESNIQDLRQKTLAYQKVVAKHPIATAPDYQKALDEKYTLHSFRHEIKDMMHTLNPDTIRKKRAEALIEESRERYQAAIHNSQHYFNALSPLKPHSYFDRKRQFKSSWHQEPVCVSTLPTDSNKCTERTLRGKVQHATRKHKKRVDDSLPVIASNLEKVGTDMHKNDNVINNWVNSLPKELARPNNAPHLLENSLSRNNEVSSKDEQSKEETSVSNTHHKNSQCDGDSMPSCDKNITRNPKNSQCEGDSMPSCGDKNTTGNPKNSQCEGDSMPSCDKNTTRNQHGDYPERNCDQKPDQSEHLLNIPTKPKEDHAQEVRNDSGYGTAESELEITPRLRDGKEWKSMSMSKQKVQK